MRTALLGARPSRFRRARVLIIGCGDVGLRAARELLPQVRVLALTSTADRKASLRDAGIVPLVGNLEEPCTLRRLAGLGQRVLHLAPPASDGSAHDARTLHLLRALRLRTPPASLAYASTTGVYGDCQGALIDETRAVNPQTDRARRRVHAEQQVRLFGRATACAAIVLRIPGIYAPDRVGGTPRERLLRGVPVLTAEEDVYTNHVHADDLARALVAALWRGRPQRVVNACDDTDLRMADYFDRAADLLGLPRPPRMTRAEISSRLSPVQLSFMSESRRLGNERLKRELRLRLRYPTVQEGLAGAAA